MAEFFSILKRKSRGSSNSSESGALTLKEKRFCKPLEGKRAFFDKKEPDKLIIDGHMVT